jgi:hypothetical protein
MTYSVQFNNPVGSIISFELEAPDNDQNLIKAFSRIHESPIVDPRLPERDQAQAIRIWMQTHPAELAAITVLNLENLELTKIPPEIGLLPNIEILVLKCNLLTSLEGFPILHKLKELTISQNHLRSLIGLPYLESLIDLYVSENCLTDLTGLPELLPNLQRLYLWRNQLVDVRDLSRSLCLKELFLDDNRLETLSYAVFHLPRNCEVFVDCNPFTPTYIAQAEARIAEIRRYDPTHGPNLHFSDGEHEIVPLPFGAMSFEPLEDIPEPKADAFSFFSAASRLETLDNIN